MHPDPRALRVRATFGEGWQLLRRCLPRCLRFGMVFTAIGAVVLSPFVVWLSDAALGIQGSTVALNFDISGALLSPAGFLALLVWSLGAAVLVVLGLGGQVLLTADADRGTRRSLAAVWRATLGAAPRLFHWALLRVALLALVILPLLALILGTLHALVVGVEDNLALSFLPTTAFGQVLFVAALLALALGCYAVLIRWTFVLHAMLLERRGLGDAMQRSATLIRTQRAFALRTIISFHLGSLAILALGSGFFHLVAWFCFTQVVPEPSGAFVVVATLLAIGSGFVSLAVASGVGAYAAATATVLFQRLGGTLGPSTEGKREAPHAGPSLRVRLIAALLLFALAFAFVGRRVGAIVQTEIDMVGVTAHRGSSAAAPENTMAAFRLALDEKTEWIELDVMEAGDGSLVVVHDINLKRIAGVDRAVYEMTLDELQALDVGSHFDPGFSAERMPTLADVMQLVRSRAQLNIELKTHGQERAFAESVLKLIEAEQFRDECVITSLDYGILQSVRRLDPGLRLGAIVTASVGNVHALDVDFYSVAQSRATVPFIRKAHALGREVHAWTVNGEQNLRLMMDRGVDNVITDLPARALALRDARTASDDFRGLLIRIFGR